MNRWFLFSGAGLNPALAYVSEMSSKDLLAYVLTVVLVSLHTSVSERIAKGAAGRKTKSPE